MKVGDYYYHGLGVPDEPESVCWEKAAGYYQSVADTQNEHNSLSMSGTALSQSSDVTPASDEEESRQGTMCGSRQR